MEIKVSHAINVWALIPTMWIKLSTDKEMDESYWLQINLQFCFDRSICIRERRLKEATHGELHASRGRGLGFASGLRTGRYDLVGAISRAPKLTEIFQREAWRTQTETRWLSWSRNAFISRATPVPSSWWDSERHSNSWAALQTQGKAWWATKQHRRNTANSNWKFQSRLKLLWCLGSQGINNKLYSASIQSLCRV